MAPLRPLPFREVKRKLEAAAFSEHSLRGSHIKFVRQTGEGIFTTVVPRHREVAAGTLRSIIRQANITPEDWETL